MEEALHTFEVIAGDSKHLAEFLRFGRLVILHCQRLLSMLTAFNVLLPVLVYCLQSMVHEPHIHVM
jgi:hypothetical protein